MASSNAPLLAYLNAEVLTNAELNDILREGAEEAERLIPKLLEKHTTGGKIRSGQLALVLREIRAMQARLWKDIDPEIRAGMVRAGEAAAEGEDVLLDYLRRNGLPVEDLLDSFRAQARKTIQGLYAKAANNISLSKQVYKTQAWATGLVHRRVNIGILLGHGAREIAKAVKDLIDPSVRGGVSYAAKRLARTELNNAFHTAQVQRYRDEPWTRGMQWRLSGSHPTKDECDVLARTTRGLGLGVFPTNEVPGKPHPQCLCYLVPSQIEEDEFIDGFLAGEYDEYLDSVEQDAETTVVSRAKFEAVQATTPTRFPSSADDPPSVRPDVRDHLLKVNMVGGEHREIVQRSLEEQAKLLPNSMLRFNGVTLMTNAELRAFERKHGKDALGGYVREQASMVVTPQVFTDKYEKAFRREVASGWLSKCGHDHDGAESFFAHECGHHVEAMMRRAGPANVKSVWTVLAQALGLKPPFFFDDKSLDKWTAKHAAKLKVEVSRYGATDHSELLAEIWAEYSTNPEARPHVRAVGEEMRRLAEMSSL